MFKKIMRLAEYFSNPLKNFFLGIFGRLPKIEWVVFEVTDACNSRCRHCNIWKEKTTQDILTIADIKKIFSDPLLKHVKAVLITGGEPVLRDDIVEIFETIHDAVPKAQLTLSTNGLLPQRVIDVVRAAIANNISFDVGVSLDAVGEKNDEIRGVKGSFEKVDFLLDQLSKLKKNASFNVIVGHTLSPLTVDTVDQVRDYAKAKGTVFLTQLYDDASFYHNVGEIDMQKDAFAMAKAISKIKPSFHKEFLKEILKNKILHFDCFSFRTFFLLRCNGNVTPCLKFSHLSAGSVKQQSFSEIWKSEAAWQLRKKIKDCQGCANSWATDWSLKSNYFPLLPLLFRTFVNWILRR